MKSTEILTKCPVCNLMVSKQTLKLHIAIQSRLSTKHWVYYKNYKEKEENAKLEKLKNKPKTCIYQ